MATLSTASRLCLLRSAAASKPAAAAGVRTLSATALRRDGSGTSSTYSSPFRGESSGSKVPDFGKYMSKGGEGSNKLFSYFMVGAMGALTAAGAKSTVQGMLAWMPLPEGVVAARLLIACKTEFLVNMSVSADILAMAKVEVDLNAIPEGKNVSTGPADAHARPARQAHSRCAGHHQVAGKARLRPAPHPGRDRPGQQGQHRLPPRPPVRRRPRQEARVAGHAG